MLMRKLALYCRRKLQSILRTSVKTAQQRPGRLIFTTVRESRYFVEGPHNQTQPSFVSSASAARIM
jgi:hypothetical protein